MSSLIEEKIAAMSLSDECSEVVTEEPVSRCQHPTLNKLMFGRDSEGVYRCSQCCCDFRLEPVKPGQSTQHENKCNSSTTMDSENIELVMSSQNPGSSSSRLLREFVDLNEGLGEGGFGAVRKYRNKLDGQTYAIKRIKLGSSSLDGKTKREVELLSALYHDNIVRYFNCWIEDFYLFPPARYFK